MAYWNVVRTASETIKIDDLGYRNSSYILRVDGKVFRFPTEDEAMEYIDDLFGNSGE